MRPFPLMLLCADRYCLVIGEGDLADAKARLARGAGLIVKQAQTLELSSFESFSNGSIAFVIQGKIGLAVEWSSTLRHHGFLVNVADQPDISDFILPALIDRDPVIVAISTGGASATVARQLRGKIEALLPSNLGASVSFIQSIRPQVAEIILDSDERRLFWDAMTGEGGVCDPFSIAKPPESAAVLVMARNFTAEKRQQRVTLIKLQSDDPADMTLRGLRRLHQADLVICVGREEKLEGFAALARRDARIQHVEKLINNCDYINNYRSVVILLAPEGRIGSILPKNAMLEILTTGQAQL
jgi:uroporphyrin-III C-methyltransferase / precorrin-2 dehydrogenase / sirohydrochlorin ferrochelatase